MRDHEEAADRLEAALNRIEQLARTPSASPAAPVRDNAEVAARLDHLIAQLRAALDEAEA